MEVWAEGCLGTLPSYERSRSHIREKSEKFYADWGPSSHGAQLARSRAGRLGVRGGGKKRVSLASDSRGFGLVRQIWECVTGSHELTVFRAFSR